MPELALKVDIDTYGVSGTVSRLFLKHWENVISRQAFS
jgi:hypothetical protein